MGSKAKNIIGQIAKNLKNVITFLYHEDFIVGNNKNI